MSAAADLRRALACFVRAYRERPALVAEQRGWSPRIVLRATDAQAAVAVELDDGRIAGEIADASTDEAAQAATLIVAAEVCTLCDVLEGRRDASEPYLFGELTVTGHEADFLRLDYIASQLCPRRPVT